jgi:hypothetical protein
MKQVKLNTMSHNKFTAGAHIIYDDGRKGHSGVKAVILESDAKSMTVQFDDRAATTKIYFTDKEWMDFITVSVNPINN